MFIEFTTPRYTIEVHPNFLQATEYDKEEDKGNGMKPLHFAAHHNIVAMATWLLDSGDDVNRYADNQTTALHFAASAGNVEMVRLLIERGADIERTRINGELEE